MLHSEHPQLLRKIEVERDPGFFEVLSTARAMRRLRPDPVPEAMLAQVLEAGTKAPSGLNTQPWEFLVVRDAGVRRWIARHYLRVATERFGEMRDAHADLDTPFARLLRNVFRQAARLEEAPVLLFVCSHRDWPFWVPDEDRVGPPPPPYGAIFPCVQNILLACRALGLGSLVTTMHRMFEAELAAHLGVPPEIVIAAMLPIGFPEGEFGPVRRVPATLLTHLDRFGVRAPLVNAAKETE